MEERHRDIALFRYALIREAADPALSPRQRGALVRALAEADHVGPGGRRIRVTRSTLDRWIKTWSTGGFEALAPARRSASPATPLPLLELAEALKRENPRRTAALIAILIAESHPGVSTPPSAPFSATWPPSG